jgi:hypothetical protein
MMAFFPPAIYNGIPLSTLLEWYKIRDTFFGKNYVSQNIPLALELASSCQHPDARWLTESCHGKDVTTKEDAKRVFSALGENDARALCFFWQCCTWTEQEDSAKLRRSAELGFAWAQALMVSQTQGEERGQACSNGRFARRTRRILGGSKVFSSGCWWRKQGSGQGERKLGPCKWFGAHHGNVVAWIAGEGIRSRGSKRWIMLICFLLLLKIEMAMVGPSSCSGKGVSFLE